MNQSLLSNFVNARESSLLIKNQQYSCNVDPPEIDARHKALYAPGMSVYENWLVGGSIDTLRPALVSLDNLLKAHFSFEEELLAKIGCYNIDEHQRNIVFLFC